MDIVKSKFQDISAIFWNYHKNVYDGHLELYIGNLCDSNFYIFFVINNINVHTYMYKVISKSVSAV